MPKKDRPKERVHIKKKSKKVSVDLAEEWNKHEPVKIMMYSSKEGINALDDAIEAGFKAEYNSCKENLILNAKASPTRCFVPALYNNKLSNEDKDVKKLALGNGINYPKTFVVDSSKADKIYDKKMEGYLEEYIQEALKGPKEKWIEKLKEVFYKFWK